MKIFRTFLATSILALSGADAAQAREFRQYNLQELFVMTAQRCQNKADEMPENTPQAERNRLFDRCMIKSGYNPKFSADKPISGDNSIVTNMGQLPELLDDDENVIGAIFPDFLNLEDMTPGAIQDLGTAKKMRGMVTEDDFTEEQAMTFLGDEYVSPEVLEDRRGDPQIIDRMSQAPALRADQVISGAMPIMSEHVEIQAAIEEKNVIQRVQTPPSTGIYVSPSRSSDGEEPRRRGPIFINP